MHVTVLFFLCNHKISGGGNHFMNEKKNN